MSLGSHWPLHSPSQIGHLGTPFYPQGLDMIHVPINQIATELRQVSAQLVKAEAECTQFMEQVISILIHWKHA